MQMNKQPGSEIPNSSTKPIKDDSSAPASANSNDTGRKSDSVDTDELAEEFGGQKGPDPTRYGDWEKNGRCTDF